VGDEILMVIKGDEISPGIEDDTEIKDDHAHIGFKTNMEILAYQVYQVDQADQADMGIEVDLDILAYQAYQADQAD